MNPPNGQTSLDYLNQISAPVQKRGGPGFGLNLKTILLGSIAAIVIVMTLVIIVNIANGGKAKAWEQLPLRLSATSSTADAANGLIKNSRLRTANSDLRIYLTNTQRDLTAILQARGIDTKKLPKDLAAAEADQPMLDRLEVGRLNARYDSTYAREMSYKLSTILALYTQLYNQGGSTETRAFLTKAYDELMPTHKAISEFSASNE